MLLPSVLFQEIESYLYHQELIVGVLSTCKGLLETRAERLSLFKYQLTELTRLVISHHDMNLIAFLDNLDAIKAKKVTLFKQLPLSVTMDPLQFAFRSILWTALGNARVSEHNSLVDESSTFFSHQLHAFRFNWQNTRAEYVYDDAQRLRILPFLYDLKNHEEVMNEALWQHIDGFLQRYPQWEEALRDFRGQKLVYVTVRFEGVQYLGAPRMKQCHLTLSFNAAFLQTFTILRNAIYQTDAKSLVTPYHFQGKVPSMLSFCFNCLFSDRHKSDMPAYFLGSRMAWYYDEKTGNRHQSTQCAVFPVAAFSSGSQILPYMKLIVCPLPVDDGHLHIFQNHPSKSHLDFNDHMCEPLFQYHHQWPTDVGVTRDDLLDTIISDFLLLFV